MKKSVLFIGLMALTFSSCKKAGCTDKDAVNYSSEAKTTDNSCTFEGRHVFWYNQEFSQQAVDEGIESIKFYVDGNFINSRSASSYWVSAPDCGQDNTITVTKSLGASKSKSFSYKVTDELGNEISSGNLEFKANTCTAFQLIP